MGNSASEIPEEGVVQSPRKANSNTISTQATLSPMSNSSFSLSPKKAFEKLDEGSPSGGSQQRAEELKKAASELSSDMIFCSKLNSVRVSFPRAVNQVGEFLRETEYDRSFLSEGVPNVGPLMSKSTGNTYMGGIREGIPHGYGKFVSVDGTYIEGYFKNGFPDYKILKVSPNGEAYNGGWQNDKRHGFGTYLSMEGSVTQSDWYEDKMHGNCLITDIDGEVIFQGKMVKNRKEGNCLFKDKKKCITYKGDFRDGLFYGFGVLTCPDGIYHGTFKVGKKEGSGVYKKKDGTVLKGMWICDDFISPEYHEGDNSTAYRKTSLDDSSIDI